MCALVGQINNLILSMHGATVEKKVNRNTLNIISNSGSIFIFPRRKRWFKVTDLFYTLKISSNNNQKFVRQVCYKFMLQNSMKKPSVYYEKEKKKLYKSNREKNK